MGTLPLEAFFFKDFKNSYIPNILEEVYKNQVYLPLLRGKKDLTIVEIGANIGLVSYYFKDFAKVVYAIEPSAIHLECLNSMIKGPPAIEYREDGWAKVTYPNQIKNIKVCPYAISGQDGKEKFYHSQNTTSFSLKSSVVAGDDYEEVETKTLASFIEENDIENIDLLKLDAEGAEDMIIASEGFQKYAGIISQIIGEWHSWTGVSKDLFKNTLTDLGFDFKWAIGTDASIFTATRP